MKSKGKPEGGVAVKMVCLDNRPGGRRRYEHFNWVCQIYRIPRFYANKCSDLTDFAKAGTYILLGKEDGKGKKGVYIGKAEEVKVRLGKHISDPFPWEEALVIISLNDWFNNAHAGYLENRLYEIAVKVGACVLQNGNTPLKVSLSEHEKVAMEEFIRQVKFILSTADIKIFEENEEEKEEVTLFHIRAARGTAADGFPVAEGFKVLKGSFAGDPLTPSCNEGNRKIRYQLMQEHILEKQKDGRFMFVRDYVFKSASAAASVVMGGNADGLEMWKTRSGKTLKMMKSEC